MQTINSTQSIISDSKIVNVASLMHMRGNNKAVVELSTSVKEKLVNILSFPDKFSREDLLKVVLSSYSGLDYGDYHWRKVIGGWTTPEVNTIYGDFLDDFPDFSQLSLDSGFITHLAEFIELIKNIPTNGLEGFEMRERFKEKLGYKTVWRGMMLTEDELNYIENNGILSPLMEFIKKTDYKKEEFEAKMFSIYINELIESHFHGENYFSPFISVSSHENIAISVGRHFGNKRDNRKFYLFKIKVPEVDRIFYTEHGVRIPEKLRGFTGKLSIGVNDIISEFNWDKETESFLSWKIDQDEILDITQPNVKQSSWNSKETLGDYR